MVLVFPEIMPSRLSLRNLVVLHAETKPLLRASAPPRS